MAFFFLCLEILFSSLDLLSLFSSLLLLTHTFDFFFYVFEHIKT